MRLGGQPQEGQLLQAQFHRLRARADRKKAICAVAASILTAVYHMLSDGTDYQDLGPDHFDRRPEAVQANRLAHRLKSSASHAPSPQQTSAVLCGYAAAEWPGSTFVLPINWWRCVGVTVGR